MNAASARLIGIAASVSLLLGACATSSPDAAQSPSSATASQQPAAPSPPQSIPSPTPTPSPTILPITSDDLTDALPTNPMLSKVQGSTFKENRNWVGGRDEGPEWVADSPLTKKQKYQVSIGVLRRVKPDKCEAAAVNWSGWTQQWATGDYFKAVGYTKKMNSYRYWKTGNVWAWQSIAYLLPTGGAQVWSNNLAATYDECVKFTTIAANGDVKKINVASALKKSKTELRRSSAALISFSRPATGGRAQYVTLIWEPIGSVLYISYIHILSTSPKQWARASALYNRLADSLAKAQGVQREPVDLIGGTEITPNPADYMPPPKPGSSLV